MHDENEKVNKEFCELQHHNTNEKLDNLNEGVKKLLKILLGNGEKGMIEKQNTLETRVENIENYISECKENAKET